MMQLTLYCSYQVPPTPKEKESRSEKDKSERKKDKKHQQQQLQQQQQQQQQQPEEEVCPIMLLYFLLSHMITRLSNILTTGNLSFRNNSLLYMNYIFFFSCLLF